MIAREDHLFGLLAVQSGLVDAVALLDVWGSLTGSERLPDLLVRRGLMSPEDRDHVDYLVRRKLPASGSTPLTVSTSAVGSPDRYEYVDLCGSGGMGEVWRARDTRLEREVAIKELKRDLASNDSVRTRFLREVRLTSQLDHPGIVPVYDLLPDDDGRPRYAMRLLHGRTMAEAIRDLHRRRRAGEDISLQRAELLSAFVAVCNTIGYAHSRGVLHRDLKPANIQLGDFGEVVVLDWGLAGVKQTEPPSDCDRVTSPGCVFGTPEYMSPEQAVGDVANISERSDIYGLGAILYQLLTGSPPFEGESMAETLSLVRVGELTAVRQRCPEVPAGLEAICQKALSKRAQDRFEAATDLATAVLQWQESERQAAERALRESEERFRTLFEAVPQSLWIAGRDGRIEFTNRKTERGGLSRRSDEEIADLGWRHLVHPDDLPTLDRVYAQAQATGDPYECEFRWRMVDDSYRWVLSRAVPLRNAEGRVVKWFGSTTDVHELKTAIQQRDEALALAQASEEQYRTLAEAIPQTVWIRRPDGYIEYINRRSFGTSEAPFQREQFMGQGWRELFHADDLPRAWKTFLDAQEAGTPYESEYRLRLPDGSYRWFLSRALPLRDAQGQIIRWFGTSTDIQDLKETVRQRDEALARAQKSEERFRTLVEAVPQSLWAATPDGSMEYFNNNASVGSRRRAFEEIGGFGWQAFIHPEDLPLVMRAWEQAQISGEDYTVEHRWKDPDDAFRWVSARAVPLRDSDGRIVQWFGYTADIHHLKTAMQERDEALSLARASERRYRLLTDLIPQNVWTADPNGRLFYANQRGLDYHGLGPGSLGDEWQSVVHADDLPNCLRRWQESIDSGGPYEFEFRLRNTAGEYRWHLSRAFAVRDETGRLEQWFGTNTDIHDLKLAIRQRDEALSLAQASEQRYRLLAEKLPQVVWSMSAEGKLVYLNRYGLELLDQRLEDILGDRWHPIIHPEDLPGSLQLLQRAMASGQSIEFEFRARVASGEYRWFLCRNTPVRNAEGRVVEWIGTNTDIHDLKTAAEERLGSESLQ